MMSEMNNDGPTVDLIDINWPCDGCQELKQKLAKIQAEHASNYTTLKQKIISTDLLIKKFKAKCDKFDNQSKVLEETKGKLEKVQRDSETLDKQMKAALEQLEPLKMANGLLVGEKYKQAQEISDLKDKLQAAENMQLQFKQLMSESTQNKEQNEVNQKRVDSLESSTKKQRTTISKLRGDVYRKKVKLSELEKTNKTLESDHANISAKLERYIQILDENDVAEMEDFSHELEEMVHSFVPEILSEDEMDDVAMAAGGFCEIKMSDIFSDVLRLSAMTPLSPLAPSLSESEQGNEASSGPEGSEEEEELSKLAGMLENEILQPDNFVNTENGQDSGNTEHTSSSLQKDVGQEIINTISCQESTHENSSTVQLNKNSDVKSSPKTQEQSAVTDKPECQKAQDLSNNLNLTDVCPQANEQSIAQNEFGEEQGKESESLQKDSKQDEHDQVGTLVRRISPLKSLCLPSLLEDEIVENSTESRGVPIPTDPESLSDTESCQEVDDDTLEAAKKVTRQSTTEFVVSKDPDIESLDENSNDQGTTTTSLSDSVFTSTITNSQVTISTDFNFKTENVKFYLSPSKENGKCQDITSNQIDCSIKKRSQGQANGDVINETSIDSKTVIEKQISDANIEDELALNDYPCKKSVIKQSQIANQNSKESENCVDIKVNRSENLSVVETENSTTPRTNNIGQLETTNNGFSIDPGKGKIDPNRSKLTELGENLDHTFTAQEIIKISNAFGIVTKKRSKRSLSDPIKMLPRMLRSGSTSNSACDSQNDCLTPTVKINKEQTQPPDSQNSNSNNKDDQELASPKIKRRRSSLKCLRRSPRLSCATINKDANIDTNNENVKSCNRISTSPLININKRQSEFLKDKDCSNTNDELFAEDLLIVNRRVTRALARRASRGWNHFSGRDLTGSTTKPRLELQGGPMSRVKMSVKVKSESQDSISLETRLDLVKVGLQDNVTALVGGDPNSDNQEETSSEFCATRGNGKMNGCERIAGTNPSEAAVHADPVSNVALESNKLNNPASQVLYRKPNGSTVNTGDENKNSPLCKASAITLGEETVSLHKDISVKQPVVTAVQCSESTNEANKSGDRDNKSVNKLVESQSKDVVLTENCAATDQKEDNRLLEVLEQESVSPDAKVDCSRLRKNAVAVNLNKAMSATKSCEQYESGNNEINSSSAQLNTSLCNVKDKLQIEQTGVQMGKKSSVEDQINYEPVSAQAQNGNEGQFNKKNSTDPVTECVKQSSEMSKSEPSTPRHPLGAQRKHSCSVATDQLNNIQEEMPQECVLENLENNESNVSIQDRDGERDIPLHDEVKKQIDTVIDIEPQAGPSRLGGEQPRPMSLTLSSTFVPIYIPSTTSLVPSVIRQSTSSIAVVSPQTSEPVVGSYSSASMSRSATPSSGCSISASSPVSPLPPSPFEYLNIIPISPLPPSPAPAEPLSPLPSSPSWEEDPSDATVVEVHNSEMPDSQQQRDYNQNIEEVNILEQPRANSPFRVPSIVSLQPTPLPLPLTPLPSTPSEAPTAVTPDLQVAKSNSGNDPNCSSRTVSNDGQRPSTSRHTSGNEGQSRRNLEQSFSKVSHSAVSVKLSSSTSSDQPISVYQHKHAKEKAKFDTTITDDQGCVSILKAKKRISHCKSESLETDSVAVANLDNKRKSNEFAPQANILKGPRTTSATSKKNNKRESSSIKASESGSQTSEQNDTVQLSLHKDNKKSSTLESFQTPIAAERINNKRKSNELSAVEMSAAGDPSSSKKQRQTNKKQNLNSLTNLLAHPGGDPQNVSANKRKLSNGDPSTHTEILHTESSPSISVTDLPTELIKEISQELEGYLRVSGADPHPMLERILVGKSPEQVLEVLVRQVAKTGADCSINHILSLLPSPEANISPQDGPFISKKETQIVTLLYQFLEEVKKQKQIDMSYQLMSSLWKEIFNSSSEGLNGDVAMRLKTELCRIFAAICRLQGDLVQCRIFIYHVFRCSHLSYPIICLAVSCVWPLALQKSTEYPSPLLDVVEFLIMKTLSSGKSKHELMLKTFKRLCLWETSECHSSQPVHEKLQTQLDELVNSAPPLNHNYVFEFFKTYELLLIKEDWGKIIEVINIIFPHIGKLVSNRDEAMMHGLISPILKMFGSLLGTLEGLHDKIGDLKQIIIRVIHYLLTVKLDTIVPMTIQEDAIELLLRLSPFSVSDVADRLRIWLPKHINRISAELKIQLRLETDEGAVHMADMYDNGKVESIYLFARTLKSIFDMLQWHSEAITQ